MVNISKKFVCGVGRKGDGVTRINGKNTKVYATWSRMLTRCYDPKFLSKQPTYVGCSVCDEWLFFPNFKKWFDENYVEGFQLDKDLLVTGNKRYCPEACVFAPPPINILFTDSGRSRGNYPIGIYLHKRSGKFLAQLRIDGTRKHLGSFNTVDEAHQAYLITKKKNVIRVANIWKDKISSKLYDALIQKAEDMV